MAEEWASHFTSSPMPGTTTYGYPFTLNLAKAKLSISNTIKIAVIFY